MLSVTLNEKQEPIVGGRELHEALEIQTRYNDWFPRMCEYGFIENQDYCTLYQDKIGSVLKNEQVQNLTQNQMSAMGIRINHAIKLDMAKEIAMIQRNEKGKQIRQYFIQVEKDFNSPEKIMARALSIAKEQIEELVTKNKTLEIELKENEPKIIFANTVATSSTSILIGDLAKLIKQKGYDIGQNRLFCWMRENGYLIKSGESKNMPTQTSMNLELFEVKERSVVNPDGSNRVTRTTKVTGKGQIYFINKFIKE
jgi:anti-repressor protein